MRGAILLILALCPFFLFGGVTLKGKVTDSSGEALPFATIYIKGTSKGTTTNVEGVYAIELDKGSYEVIYQYVGYKNVQKIIQLDAKDVTVDVVLEPQSVSLDEIVISANSEDPAYAIIRKAIAKRKYYKNQVEGYSCDVYIKGNQKILNAPEKIMGQEIGDLGGMLDTTRKGIVYLSESVSKLHYQNPDQFKEEMLSSKVSGNDNGFSFNQARAMNFSLYESTTDLGRPLVSPIAPNALLFYDYKLEGAFYDEGQLVNKIRIQPKSMFGNAYNGYIYINEDLWNIHSTELWVTRFQTKIPYLDTATVRQIYLPVQDSVWMLFSQTIGLRISLLQFEIDGYFLGAFTNYNINPDFPDKFFNNEVFNVYEESNKKLLSYWDSIRPIPLTVEEESDYIKKDSLQVLWQSKEYLDSMDRKNNKFKTMNLLLGYTYNRSWKKAYFQISPPLNTLQFNAVQGYNLALEMEYQKEFDDIHAKWIRFEPAVSYGFAEKKFRGKGKLTYNFNRKKFTRLSIGGGQDIAQFNGDNPISPMNNSNYTIFGHINHARYYDKVFGELQFRHELVNGIFMQLSTSYARRSPLSNNTEYSYFFRDRQYAPNVPENQDFSDQGFVAHEAMTVLLSLRFRYKQEYIRYPGRKIITGSKYPDLWIHYRRGIPALGAITDFDQLSATLNDKIQMGIFGFSEYKLGAGLFLTKNRVPFIDYQHINGNQTIFGDPQRYLSAFHMLPYYAYSTTGPWMQAHYQHHFNGFIWNKLPLLKRLSFTTVAFGHLLLSSTDDWTLKSPYIEAGFGVEQIGWSLFRFFRVDFVMSMETGKIPKPGFVIGIDLPIN